MSEGFSSALKRRVAGFYRAVVPTTMLEFMRSFALALPVLGAFEIVRGNMGLGALMFLSGLFVLALFPAFTGDVDE